MLNISVRNCRSEPSRMRKRLKIEKSKLVCGGPLPKVRLELPNANAAGAVKQLLSNQRVTVRSEPGRLPSQMRSGRLAMVLLSNEGVIVAPSGNPLRKRVIPLNCHPPTSWLRAGLSVDK